MGALGSTRGGGGCLRRRCRGGMRNTSLIPLSKVALALVTIPCHSPSLGPSVTLPDGAHGSYGTKCSEGCGPSMSHHSASNGRSNHQAPTRCPYDK